MRYRIKDIYGNILNNSEIHSANYLVIEYRDENCLNNIDNILKNYNLKSDNYNILGKSISRKKYKPDKNIILSKKNNKTDLRLIGKYKNYFIWQDNDKNNIRHIVTVNNGNTNSKLWPKKSGNFVTLCLSKNPWNLQTVNRNFHEYKKKEYFKVNTNSKLLYGMIFIIIFIILLYFILIN